jgi:hypothetical protein
VGCRKVTTATTTTTILRDWGDQSEQAREAVEALERRAGEESCEGPGYSAATTTNN